MLGVNKDDYCLTADMVQPIFRDPFIQTGYRKPNMTAKDCLKTASVMQCNEFANLWSHLIGFLFFAIKFSYVLFYELDITDAQVWPLISLALGILGFCLVSVVAHTFNCMSESHRNNCFFMDYVSISCFGSGIGQCIYFFSSTRETTTEQLPWILATSRHFFFFSFMTSLTATYFCCASRSGRLYAQRYTIRGLACFASFVYNTMPYLHKWIISRQTVTSFDLFFKFSLCYFLAGIINSTKFPERIFPVTFDTFGQSHNIMHILTILAANYNFEFCKNEMVLNKNVKLSRFDRITFWNTVMLYVATVFMNFGLVIAIYFIKQCKEKRLNCLQYLKKYKLS